MDEYVILPKRKRILLLTLGSFVFIVLGSSFILLSFIADSSVWVIEMINQKEMAYREQKDRVC
jgi:hypothetical protein